MEELKELTREIAEQLEEKREWSLSRDRVLELIGADIRDVYGLMSGSANPLVSFQKAEYSSREPGVLVTLLECLGYAGGPRAFWEAGIWIPYEIQIELQEELLERVISARNSYNPSYDTFLAIFDHYSHLIRALQIYTQEFFPEDFFLEEAVRTLLRNHPETCEQTAEALLMDLGGELFRREIIPLWNLFNPLFTELKNYLIKMKRIPAPEDDHRAGARSDDRTDGLNVLDRARKLFGYSLRDPIEKRDLKKRYKDMMKKYHPDVNPEGLEKSKMINLAYGQLLVLSQ